MKPILLCKPEMDALFSASEASLALEAEFQAKIFPNGS